MENEKPTFALERSRFERSQDLRTATNGHFERKRRRAMIPSAPTRTSPPLDVASGTGIGGGSAINAPGAAMTARRINLEFLSIFRCGLKLQMDLQQITFHLPPSHVCIFLLAFPQCFTSRNKLLPPGSHSQKPAERKLFRRQTL